MLTRANTLLTLVCAASLWASVPGRASADVTVFGGSTGTGTGRAPMAGLAVSWFPRAVDAVRIEFEGWGTTRSADPTHHRVQALGMSVIVFTTSPRARVRPYAALGAGLYGETSKSGGGSGESSGKHVGGGARVRLAGAVFVRLDYRAYFIDAPDASLGFAVGRRPQRLTAEPGLTL